MIIPNSFGARLRYYRIRRGWSLERLAFECKRQISGGYIGRLERGQDSNPSELTYRILSEGLGVSMVELKEGVETGNDESGSELYPLIAKEWFEIERVWDKLSPSRRKLILNLVREFNHET